jgi:hypothetical protein
MSVMSQSNSIFALLRRNTQNQRPPLKKRSWRDDERDVANSREKPSTTQVLTFSFQTSPTVRLNQGLQATYVVNL